MEFVHRVVLCSFLLSGRRCPVQGAALCAVFHSGLARVFLKTSSVSKEDVLSSLESVITSSESCRCHTTQNSSFWPITCLFWRVLKLPFNSVTHNVSNLDRGGVPTAVPTPCRTPREISRHVARPRSPSALVRFRIAQVASFT